MESDETRRARESLAAHLAKTKRPFRPCTEWPTGRVATLDDMCGGLFEWRFVPADWVDPLPHHHWCVISIKEDPTTFVDWLAKLKDCPPVTWYLGKDERYTAEVSYDPVARPVLVKIGGFR